MSKTGRLASLYHNLSIMLDAGMPLIRALDVTSSNSLGKTKNIFAKLSQAVNNGDSLAESMSRYSRFFAQTDVRLVDAAETAGRLPQCFNQLSKWYEFLKKIHTTMLTGFLYPLTVLHIAIFILPVSELVLGNITLWDYLLIVGRPLLTIYISVVLLIYCIRLGKRVNLLGYIIDAIALRIPILGKGIKHLSICRYNRAFNMLYKSGVPITEALASATNLSGNRVISRIFSGAAKTASAGNPAWHGFLRKLPLEYLNLWQTGEETGELDKITEKIAEIASNKSELYLTEFAKWLPRVLYFAFILWMAAKLLSMGTQIYNIPEL